MSARNKYLNLASLRAYMPLTKMPCFFLKKGDVESVCFDSESGEYEEISLEGADYDSYIRIDGDGETDLNLANESSPLNLISWNLVLVGWGRQVSDYIKELNVSSDWIEIKSISEDSQKIQEVEKFECDKKLVKVTFTFLTINTNCDVFCDC